MGHAIAEMLNKLRNINYVTEKRNATVCAHCGKQPIEWHDPDGTHTSTRPYKQVGFLTHSHVSIATIDTEIARCVPLCKSCHLKITKSGSLTHCKHGHARTPENTIIRPNGWTECKECARLRSKRNYKVSLRKAITTRTNRMATDGT